MQHECGMQREFSDDDIAALYDELIEDMLVDTAGTVLDPRAALDLSEKVVAVNALREREGRVLAALPPGLHKQLNRYAEQGMHKGRGRRHPTDSNRKKLFDDTVLCEIAEFGCKCKEERLNRARILREQADGAETLGAREKLKREAEGQGSSATGVNSAEDKAIDDARAFAKQRYGRAPGIEVIRRAMTRLRSGSLAPFI
jgi:hypothetical protein